jgi:hypothetical protein
MVCNTEYSTPDDAVLLDAVSSRGLYFKPANAGSFVLPPCPTPPTHLTNQFDTDTTTSLRRTTTEMYVHLASDQPGEANQIVRMHKLYINRSLAYYS